MPKEPRIAQEHACCLRAVVLPKSTFQHAPPASLSINCPSACTSFHSGDSGPGRRACTSCHSRGSSGSCARAHRRARAHPHARVHASAVDQGDVRAQVASMRFEFSRAQKRARTHTRTRTRTRARPGRRACTSRHSRGLGSSRAHTHARDQGDARAQVAIHEVRCARGHTHHTTYIHQFHATHHYGIYVCEVDGLRELQQRRKQPIMRELHLQMNWLIKYGIYACEEH